MSAEWKPRGSAEKSYKARKVFHEANTSIEYGEKTWTTAQTVRDLMQNHLDAETDRYYQQVASSIFDGAAMKQYFASEKDSPERRRAEALLHAAFMFAKHVEDMTPAARLKSEVHLQTLAKDLAIRESVQRNKCFAPALLLDATREVSEQRPLVSYEIYDTEANAPAGWMSYDAFSTEAVYQKKSKDGFRFQITGVKIADHGSGFDSQLSALFLSSKTGKRHLRGKFGEGAKMSELHLLRGGASMKMRSAYTARNGDEVVRSRIWQARPQVKEGRLVSSGVEVEREGAQETGSLVSISLRRAKEGFKRELLENIDPRLGGLEKNIADFRSQGFVYAMPIDQPHLAGVDTTGDGDVQYVQGLRVELAKESFGYAKPWFSYNFLDSSIIGGRDRNEIKATISERIRDFWRNVDDPELLQTLVRTAVHDKKRNAGDSLSSVDELRVLGDIMNANGVNPLVKVQRIVDDALVRELALKKGVQTLIISESRNTPIFGDAVEYARSRGYAVKVTAANFGSYELEDFGKRLAPTYKIVSLSEIQKERAEERQAEDKGAERAEGAKEQAIREVFLKAEASVNALMQKADKKIKDFELEFEPEKVNSSQADDFDDEDDEPGWFSRFRRRRTPGTAYSPAPTWSPFSPIIVLWDGRVRINPDGVSDPRHSDPRVLQRQIEIYLLSAYAPLAEGRKREDILKGSQQLLDTLITQFIPESSPVLTAIPDKLGYEKDVSVLLRLVDSLKQSIGTEREAQKRTYEMYRKALGVGLTFREAQEMLENLRSGESYTIRDLLETRVFYENETFSYLNGKSRKWETTRFETQKPLFEWNGHPVYALNDGRYFIPAPMGKGAVLAHGEGKKREYTFSDGEHFLHIGQYDVDYGKYKNGYLSGGVVAHPGGLIVQIDRNAGEKKVSEKELIEKQLSEYSYYPVGIARREGKIASAVSTTAIPIEYGQDEWDNPVRVFQDIVQNHIDATENGRGVKLSYEVERDGQRTALEEDALIPTDKIVGFTIRDNGSGYYPSDIATMGASSKRSPLFAGKYGEGQKMVAAAALRNGLELSYESNVQNNGAGQSWKARAVTQGRMVVLGGNEVRKELVAFDIAPNAATGSGSATTLRLPKNASETQTEQWAKWVSIIDPRQRDKAGHGGLARHVRQLRRPGSERVHTVGSISVLLDEPGAVYENGLRINSQAEGSRSLSFGYDVPEIVTTRERNSYNSARLGHYIGHAFAHTTDPKVIEEILRKVAKMERRTEDLDIGRIMGKSEAATALWAEIASAVWPEYVVHSSEAMYGDIHGREDDFSFDERDRGIKRARAERAKKIQANIVHLDKNRLLDVPEKSYYGFSKLLPTAEKVIDRMETVLLPAPPVVKKVLSEVVAQSVKVFDDMFAEARNTLSGQALERYPLSEDRFAKGRLVLADAEQRGGVAIAPVGSAYHGKVDNGVVFNEGLLFEGKRRDLAETSLHEVAHIVSGERDYTEGFVTLMYELAHHLAKQQK